MAFRKGHSGNPGGLPTAHREARRSVKEALDKAFTTGEDGKPLPDGRDKLIEALVVGVAVGDSTCVKLACEYRWGKPVQPVELEPSQMPDENLKKAVIEIAEQFKQENLTH